MLSYALGIKNRVLRMSEAQLMKEGKGMAILFI